MTNATLGPHAEERGARCSEITQKGVGYVFTDQTGTFHRFRPPYIDNTTIVARGGVWEPPELPTPRRRGAYTYILWARGSDPLSPTARPLYVGKSVNPAKRIKNHMVEQPWADQVDHSLTQISQKYPTEEEAFESETRLIHDLRPIYNLSQRNYD